MTNALKMFLQNAAVTGLGIGPAIANGLQQREQSRQFDAGLGLKKSQFEAKLPIDQQNAASKNGMMEAALSRAQTAAEVARQKYDPILDHKRRVANINEELAKKQDPAGAEEIIASMGGDPNARRLSEIGADVSKRKIGERTKIAGNEATARANAEVKKLKQELADGTRFAPTSMIPFEDRVKAQQDLERLRQGGRVETSDLRARQGAIVNPNFLKSSDYLDQLDKAKAAALSGLGLTPKAVAPPAPPPQQSPSPAKLRDRVAELVAGGMDPDAAVAAAREELGL